MKNNTVLGFGCVDDSGRVRGTRGPRVGTGCRRQADRLCEDHPAAGIGRRRSAGCRLFRENLRVDEGKFQLSVYAAKGAALEEVNSGLHDGKYCTSPSH